MMGCASTTTKKPSIDHSVADPDMGSQSLGVPSFPTMGSQQRISSASSAGRNKVKLKPGHSLMDWIRLGRSGKDLTGVEGRQLEVTAEEIKKHNQEGDAWISLRGKVYNVTSYLDFHPGGVDELMRGAGEDATSLFDEVHKWVNAESMLEKCYIGKLKVTAPTARNREQRKDAAALKGPVSNGQLPPTFLAPPTPPMQTPRFDWYQTNTTVSVVVYTKWTGMQKELVFWDRHDKTLLITMYIRHHVYTVHLDLEQDVTDSYKTNVSADSGKVELVFEKTTPDIQWASVGKHLDQHNTYIQYDEYNPAYRDCTIETIESVTKDTCLYTVCLPPGCRMSVPIGYHIRIQHNIQGMDIVRSYTAVLPSLQSDSQDTRVQEARAFNLMIKIYNDGAFTPWLATLKPGNTISCSSIDGNFDSHRLRESTHLVMFAAGTGFTPMVRLIYTSLVEEPQSTRCVKLLFFNKTEGDILWRDQLCALADKHDRFTYTNCLSEADDTWAGLRGRVTKEMVSDFLPAVTQTDKLLICVCGPTPFTTSVIQYAEELGHKDSTHAFLG